MEEDNKQSNNSEEKGEVTGENAESNQIAENKRLPVEIPHEQPNSHHHDPNNLNIRTNRPPSNRSRFGIGSGVMLTILLHIVVFILLLIIYVPSTSVYLGIGVFQLIYVVPAAIIAQSKGNSKLAAGMWIMAGVTFLLNAACWGLVGLPVLFH